MKWNTPPASRFGTFTQRIFEDRSGTSCNKKHYGLNNNNAAPLLIRHPQLAQQQQGIPASSLENDTVSPLISEIDLALPWKLACKPPSYNPKTSKNQNVGAAAGQRKRPLLSEKGSNSLLVGRSGKKGAKESSFKDEESRVVVKSLNSHSSNNKTTEGQAVTLNKELRKEQPRNEGVAQNHYSDQTSSPVLLPKCPMPSHHPKSFKLKRTERYINESEILPVEDPVHDSRGSSGGYKKRSSSSSAANSTNKGRRKSRLHRANPYEDGDEDYENVGWRRDRFAQDLQREVHELNHSRRHNNLSAFPGGSEYLNQVPVPHPSVLAAYPPNIYPYPGQGNNNNGQQQQQLHPQQYLGSSLSGRIVALPAYLTQQQQQQQQLPYGIPQYSPPGLTQTPGVPLYPPNTPQGIPQGLPQYLQAPVPVQGSIHPHFPAQAASYTYAAGYPQAPQQQLPHSQAHHPHPHHQSSFPSPAHHQGHLNQPPSNASHYNYSSSLGAAPMRPRPSGGSSSLYNPFVYTVEVDSSSRGKAVHGNSAKFPPGIVGVSAHPSNKQQQPPNNTSRANASTFQTLTTTSARPGGASNITGNNNPHPPFPYTLQQHGHNRNDPNNNGEEGKASNSKWNGMLPEDYSRGIEGAFTYASNNSSSSSRRNHNNNNYSSYYPQAEPNPPQNLTHYQSHGLSPTQESQSGRQYQRQPPPPPLTRDSNNPYHQQSYTDPGSSSSQEQQKLMSTRYLNSGTGERSRR